MPLSGQYPSVFMLAQRQQHHRHGIFPIAHSSVEEEPFLRILHHPRQTLFQIPPRHSTAPQNLPSMRPYRFQVESRQNLFFVHATVHVCFVGKDQ